MNHHAASDVHPVKLLRRPAHKNHRKFQPLALVNRHNPHRIGILPHNLRFPVIHLIFLQLVNIADKMVQPMVTALFIRSRLFQKHKKIRLSSRASRHSGRIAPVSRILQNPVQKLIHAQFPRKRAVPLQFL